MKERKPLTKEQAIEAWTQVQHLIEVGAYEERSAQHYETDTWPEDGVEETTFALENWARKQALEFVWSQDTKTWSLEPIEMDVTPEDK